MEEADDTSDFTNGRHDFDTQRQRLRTEGYREGLSEGKERVLQASFNTGFGQGFAAGYWLGAAQGAKSSLESLSKLGLAQDETSPSSLQAAASIPTLNSALLGRAQQILREDNELQHDAGLDKPRQMQQATAALRCQSSFGTIQLALEKLQPIDFEMP
ncbi:hypothetical protein WJX73_007816 [Symbiochloris irregularis]|uniref:Essential protein Yae1 N-terminal domain-containing protein n=1 Tax=Symbiochloris irregularis TaxID=706552 RepID=A0AAW1NUH2_9CHLO